MILAKITGLASLASEMGNVLKAAKVVAATRSHDIAGEMIEGMQGRVAEDSGALRESIRKEDNGDGTVMVRAGGTPETTKEASTGTVDEAVLVEHGTIYQPGRPFFWPEVEAARERFGPEVIRDINDEIGGA